MFFISTRLDPVTHRDWESYSSEHETSSYHDLLAFLQRRIGVLITVKEGDVMQAC